MKTYNETDIIIDIYDNEPMDVAQSNPSTVIQSSNRMRSALKFKKRFATMMSKTKPSSQTIKKLCVAIIACMAALCIGGYYFSHFMDYQQVNHAMTATKNDHQAIERNLKGDGVAKQGGKRNKVAGIRKKEMDYVMEYKTKIIRQFTQQMHRGWLENAVFERDVEGVSQIMEELKREKFPGDIRHEVVTRAVQEYIIDESKQANWYRKPGKNGKNWREHFGEKFDIQLEAAPTQPERHYQQQQMERSPPTAVPLPPLPPLPQFAILPPPPLPPTATVTASHQQMQQQSDQQQSDQQQSDQQQEAAQPLANTDFSDQYAYAL